MESSHNSFSFSSLEFHHTAIFGRIIRTFGVLLKIDLKVYVNVFVNNHVNVNNHAPSDLFTEKSPQTVKQGSGSY